MANRPALMALLAQAFARYTTDECLSRLDKLDILCAPVLGLDDALSQPQVTANDMLLTLDHPVHGALRTPGNPLHMSGSPLIAKRPPPTLGQHSDEILAERGLDPDAIGALRQAAVIQ